MVVTFFDDPRSGVLKRNFLPSFERHKLRLNGFLSPIISFPMNR